MSARIVQNFRGKRALIVHRADGNRERLVASLRHLGLLVITEEGGVSGVRDGSQRFDALFFDADEDLAALSGRAAETARIALVGVEAPGRLAGVVRSDCCGYLVKPVRASGVYTALFIGMNEFYRRRRQALEHARLTERVRGRRVVTKAILELMRTNGIDDDKAFQWLRDESMRLRVSLETLADRYVNDEYPANDPEPRLNRRST